MRASHGLCWAGASSSQASNKSQLMFLRKDWDRMWVVFPKAWLLHRFAMVMTSLTCGWMHRCIGFNRERLPPPPLPPELCSSLSRETEGRRHAERHSSKRVRLTALFSDHGMHTSTPNHTAVNQCGGLGMERFKVNKHHSSLAETAAGYVHLGCAPAALHYVHSCLLLYSND